MEIIVYSLRWVMHLINRSAPDLHRLLDPARLAAKSRAMSPKATGV